MGNNNTEEKDSLLNKMKKAKPFFETVSTEKKTLQPQQIELQEHKETAPPAPKPPAPSQALLFSAPGTLYKKQESGWTEISPGKIQAKALANSRAQLCFVLDNTRIVLNVLILDLAHIKVANSAVIFTGLEENSQTYTGCVKMKPQDAEGVEKILKQEKEK
ncbi:hypothetical protein NEAUS07_1927 [Nematocida ausubeli]|nr:hypothetical protein NEAUS06_0542 [Nematocida ausubeli]KAI5137327.1 hypothetical protein NEAUS07_1927 [Nematocida ausubeli]